MKIAIVFKPYGTIRQPFKGGMGNFVYLLSKYLTERGHQVEVLCGKSSQLPKGVKHFKPQYGEDQYNVYSAGDAFYKKIEKACPAKRDAVNSSFGELSARFDKKIETYLSFFAHIQNKKYDVVHVVTHDILALYSASFCQTPSVISFHGHYDLLGPDFLRWLKFIKTDGTPTNTTFVSVSKFIQKEYGKFLKSQLIYNAIETDNFKPSKNRGDYLAFLGRIDYYKGLEFAIDFSRQYKIPLLIGGRIEDKIYFDKLKSKIDGKLIKFLGPQNEKQKAKLLAGAKALMMSSHYKEAFGRVTAEALASGTPVIAFNKGANPELVLKNKTGFLIKEDNLKEAKTAWDQIDKIKPSVCKKFADDNFNIKKQIVKYEKLYEKIK